jgi:hypothetical protein
MGKSNTRLSQNDGKDCGTVERRIAVRYSYDVEATCQPGSVLVSGNCWPAKAYNISTSGIGLILTRSFQPGTLLKIELQGSSTGPTCVLASVVHVTPRSQGEWLVGCAFLREMAEDELQSLLKETQTQ